MKHIKIMNKQKRRSFALLFILLGTIFAGIIAISPNTPFTDDSSKKESKPLEKTETLIKESYSQEFDGTGADMPLSVQQESVETGTPLFEISNTSKSTNITFSTTNVPSDNTFSSTKSQISVENLYAPNRTIVLEDGITNSANLGLAPVAFCFTALGNAVFENLTLNIENDHATSIAQVDINIMSATSGGLPDLQRQVIISAMDIDPLTQKTYNFTHLGKSLLSSQTYNNLWFVRVLKSGGSGNARLHGEYDGGAEPDDSEDYYYSGSWSTSNTYNIDYFSTIRLSPPGGNIPTPTQIGVKINTTNVVGSTPGEGKAIIPRVFATLPTKLDYNISAQWWDVSCDITEIRVNYTKTDLIIPSSFRAFEGNSNIYWNVTRSGIDNFESGFSNYILNITIPSQWNNIQVWNGSTNKTDNIAIRSLGSGLKAVSIYDASNGDYWFLNATSTNLFSTIETNPSDKVLYTQNLDINATFSKSITTNDGALNVTIYNTTAINTQVFSEYKDNFIGGTELNFTLWDVDSSTTGYGELVIQVLWNNGSDAGFGESTIQIIGDTDLSLVEPAQDEEFYSNELFNITLYFTDSGKSDTGISEPLTIYNRTNGQTLSYDTNITEGYYFIEINPLNFPFGSNTIELSINKSYYYNQTIDYSFKKVSHTDINGEDNPSFNLGSRFRGQNFTFEFNYTDEEENMVENAQFEEIGAANGFVGHISKTVEGNYSLNITTDDVTNGISNFNYRFNMSAEGNETQVVTLILTVLLPNTKIEFKTEFENLQVPVGVNLTLTFNFTKELSGDPITSITTDNVTVHYLSGSNWVPWNRNDQPDFPNGGWKLHSDGMGNYTLNISTKVDTTPQAVYTLRINITYYSSNPGPYNSSISYITFTYGTPTTTPTNGGDDDGGSGSTKTITDWSLMILMFIIAAVVGGVVGSIVIVQKKVIAPKKKIKERVRRDATTIFDDAVNTEHILVMYKGTGTCVFFKSFGLEEIDPELISGFLTAVSSFGKEMDSQETLNEIQYGDKMLLLADGLYIRVALVLTKQASTILRQHLREFIESFEKAYATYLPKWKGQIDIFQNAGILVDEKLQTSIILPHEIRANQQAIRRLKVPTSKEILKIAQSLIKGSDRKFFFIASLMEKAVDTTEKDNADILMGIIELRKNDILFPIQISTIEAAPVSQQEKDLIRQQICKLPDLTEQEVERLVESVAQMGPAEREAYLTSCHEQEQIVSAPIKMKSGTKVINDIKAAKKEISNLKKQAKLKEKQGNIPKSIELYNNAANIATNWDLNKEFDSIEEMVRLAQIKGLTELKRICENEAKLAEKAKDIFKAIENYKKASKAASEIFKLGVSEMTKEVKRLTNKAKELEKSI